MEVRNFVTRLVIVACLSIWLVPAMAAEAVDDVAAESTQPVSPVVPEQKEELDPAKQHILDGVARIKERAEGLRGLDKAYAEASGEARESIMLQRLDRYDLLVSELREFSSLASAYREEGGDIQTLLAAFRDKLLTTGKKLRADIDAYRERFKQNGEDRDTQTSDGLKDHIFDSRLLDMSYSLLSEYVDVVESIGYDAGLSRDYLTQNLPRRLESLAGQLRLNTQRESERKKSLAVKKGDAELEETLRLIGEKQEADTKSLQLTISIAGKYGIEVADYRKLIVQATGELSAEMLDMNVIHDLFREWWLNAKHSIQSNITNIFFKAVVFILILLLFKGLAALARRVILSSVKSAKVNLSVLMQEMLLSMTSRIIMMLGLLVALAQMGVSLGPVLAGMGVVGFVVGFALQDTLGNFAAGVMILMYRPYDVGDFVEASGVFGKVKSMNLVSTTILTIDNQTLIIPNNKIWGDVIKNVTAQKVRRVDMTFGIGYRDDIPHAERVLGDILEKHEKVLSSPEPIVKLHLLGESSVDFVVRPWAKTEDYWDVYWDVTREVKMRFDAEGISIPFPQRDVHLHKTASE
ncbi:small conductance mechanosensitive channel [Alteromonadaceae bacterium Bs31]|nr:small conductance mechanosensitive channel [Alteromonadaceae bacterium Bs31]